MTVPDRLTETPVSTPAPIGRSARRSILSTERLKLLALSIANLLIWLTIGFAWWKALGFW